MVASGSSGRRAGGAKGPDGSKGLQDRELLGGKSHISPAKGKQGRAGELCKGALAAASVFQKGNGELWDFV